MNQARTGRAHVDLFGAVFVENLGVVLELGAPDHGIVAKDDLPVLDDLFYRNQLQLAAYSMQKGSARME